MRILYVTETLGVGGAEMFLCNLANSLKKEGCDLEVAYLFMPNTLSSSFSEAGISVHYLAANKRNVMFNAWKIAHLIKVGNFDVVHAHLFHAVLVVALSRIFGRRAPAVVTFHNRGYDAYPPKTLFKRMVRFLDGVLTRWGFNAWLAVSKAVADSTQRNLRLSSVQVMSNGIDFGLIEAALKHTPGNVRACYEIPAKAHIVILPGRLVWEKGHQFFLNAWTEVRRRVPDALGVIVGDGPLKEDIMVRIAQDESLRLIPTLAQTELFSLIHASDVVAVPSLSEGWPLVVAEAMALGKPIVCTDAGGIPEVVASPHNACFVPKEDVGALANAIIELLENPDLCKEMGSRARNRAHQTFSIDATARRHLELYRELPPPGYRRKLRPEKVAK